MEQTEVLALWGAVTGTIGTFAGLLGLWLRFRQHGLDKSKLKCESSFGFDSPNSSKHQVTVRSVGRRPVSIDGIQYCIEPKNWKQKLFKQWHYRNGRWVWFQKVDNIKLSEGEKGEIKISLPQGISIPDVLKAYVVDQTGKYWTIQWPSTRNLKQIATSEVVKELTNETNSRILKVTGYRLGERYYLATSFNTKPSRSGVPCGRSFWFLDIQNFQDKIDDIVNNQSGDFLSGKIEEIT
ncbi:hypothetical protein QTV33_004561 [Vibrio parahaemolyticus]|nr:hypothetical protein [Vibrio parahaemolyticus]